MLKEIKLEELPEGRSFSVEVTPDGAFAETTVLDFKDSGMMIAEVSGWPGGEPTTSKEASRYGSLLNNKIKKHKLVGVNAIQRGKRLFLQKTVVYRMKDHEDDKVQ